MTSPSLPPLAPLRGKRVVDLTRHAPGPFATLVCAALGAEVVKIEPVAIGDPLRSIDPEAFDRLNAGKKSLALNLKAERGLELFRRLATRADVLVEGFRPGVTSRLQIDYARLSREAPDLLYVSITGYGQNGPYRERAGHDVNYMAAAGALEGVTRPLPLQVADFAGGGLYAVLGILAALLSSQSSSLGRGRGRYLDLSMHEGVLSMLMLAGGEVGDRLSGRYPNYSVYRTRDGRGISVGALEPKFWAAFCEALDRPDLVGRMSDPGAREEVERRISSEDLSHWERCFASVDACVEAVASPDDARRHPQTVHRGAAERFALPFGTEPLPLSRAPALSQNAEEILGGLGISRKEVEALRDEGVC